MKKNKTIALLSYSLVITLVFILAPIFGETSVKHVSAETCSGAWDATVSGLKLSYQPGENIDVVVSFKARNPADCPGCTQQILVGMVDQNGKAVDVYCAYNGQAMVCPNWTTGNKAIRLKAPSATGTYKIVAANEYQYNCQDAQKVFFRQPTGPLKEIASINIEEKAMAPTTPPSPSITPIPSSPQPDESPATTSFISPTVSLSQLTQWLQQIFRSVSTILLSMAIVLGLGLVIFFLIRYFKWRAGGSDALFERVCRAIKEYELPIRTNNERAIQLALHEYLKRDFPSIKMEPHTEDRDRPDIVIEHIAIEIKAPTKNASLENLLPKCMKYGKYYSKIVFVLFAREYSPSKFEQVKEEIHNKYPKINARFIPK